MTNSQRTPKFKTGDIVYLVAGGPAMAVQEACENGFKHFTGEYWCQWFSGRKQERARFPEDSLTATNPKP